ncbi:MAG: hypothetical protein ABI467_29610 [Kofleriaceae bacterium]
MVLLTACGTARFRAEHAGTGIAVVSQRGAPIAAGAPIAVGQGAYDLRLHFEVPRAQLVEWAVTCPGADSTGSAGEPFEAYRARRLAQLEADRERDAQTAGAVTNALVGAFAPTVSAAATNGPVRTDVTVSPGAAAGTAVAASIDSRQVELPPGDVGAGPLETVVHVVASAPGTCTVTAVADDPDVLGRFELVHIRDLEAEAHARDAAIASASVQTRAAVTAQLVAFGGDPARRQREREVAARAEAEAGAAAHAHAEAELRVQHARDAEIAAHAELDLRARREVEQRQLRIAMEVRARWRVLLISWGADAEYRLHLEQREQAAQAEHARRLALLVAERERREAMMLDLSLRARLQLRAQLVAFGARERPPMPPLPPEQPGAAPFSGAVWVAGQWAWSGTAWEWSAGGWSDPSSGFGEAGGDAVQAVVVDAPVVVEAPGVTTTVVIPASPGSQGVRDHRGTFTLPSVRDHRTSSPPPANDKKVRDHR